MTNTELEIMLDALTYLGAHNAPPPSGTDEAVAWWTDAAADALLRKQRVQGAFQSAAGGEGAKTG